MQQGTALAELKPGQGFGPAIFAVRSVEDRGENTTKPRLGLRLVDASQTVLPFLRRYLLVSAALLLVAGCHKTAKSPRQLGKGEDTSYLIVALDRSDSTVVRRETMLEQLDVLAGDADSARATLDIWAFDTTPVRIWGPNLSQGAKPLREVKATELVPSNKHPRRGTRPGLLLERLARDTTVQRLPTACPLRLVVLTDGGIDHADDPALLRQAAHQLAGQHANLQVLVIGIEAQERRVWDRVIGQEIPRFKAVTWSEAEIELRQLHLGEKS